MSEQARAAEDRLATAAEATAEASQAALAWFADPANAGTVGEQSKALNREFRRFGTAARKLADAARRPMCVGVFGPSQAGKSYLVSVLARPPEGDLITELEARETNFIEEINPEGGKESTGLVTRFTINALPHPAGFPVCLRLLSEADVVKIIANSFFFDGKVADEPVPQADDLEQRLARARGAAGGEVPGLGEDDVFDIREYVERHFRGTEQVNALKPYWEEAATLLPRLATAQRAELLEPIWGAHAPFTALYRRLADALAQLGHAADAFAPVDALIPREKSVIDVATLAGLSESGGETLALAASTGARAQLPRPVVTALTAELRIVARETPRPFFEHTDLLDFPGARSRRPRALASYFDDEPEALKELFLRGKVAYLFDRYVAEQELTSMLLCIGSGNQEVTTLPDMINDWIATTHGAEPAARQSRPCVLYLVLTMFDMLFSEKAGSADENPASRFDIRMHASLLDFFAKAHRWPKEWTPGRPFANCYWLRNPNFRAENIIKYDDEGRELHLLEEKAERIDELRAGYAEVASVKAHFDDPLKAFDEALELNDGGIGYLAEKLAPVCAPEIKHAQVGERLKGVRQSMHDALKRFHLSDDVGQRLEERRAVCARIVESIYAAADYGRFGLMLEQLHVAAPDLAEAMTRAELQPDPGVRIVAATGGSERPRPRPRPRPGQGQSAPAAVAEVESEADRPRMLTRAQFLADVALRYWVERLYELPASAERVAMPAADLQELAGELIAGARRLKLVERLARDIEHWSYLDRSESALAKPALLATGLFNRYVNFVGTADLAVNERPVVALEDGAARPVFAPRAAGDDMRAIGPEPVPFAEDFLTDWVFALDRLVEENATSQEGQLVDVEQNARIGAILTTLAEPVSP